MSTHKCFHGEIRKILCGYLLLPVAMKGAWYRCTRRDTRKKKVHEQCTCWCTGSCLILTLIILKADSADDKLMIIFLFFLENRL